VAATIKAAKLIKKIRPEGVIGTGGYCSGPVVLAARLLGVKTAILEQNAVPGLTNRILGRFVHRIYTSFEEAASYFPEKKILLAGNPVRREILGVKREVRSYQDRLFSIFVFGGSQGATAINAAFLDATEHLADIWPRLKVTHQAGYNGFAQVKDAYERKGLKVELHKFINDMATAYKDCDLIICRAGATSLAEIMAVEMPSILVPYPFSSDSHQDANAKALVDKGAAIMLKQEALTGRTLADTIRGLLEDPEKLKKMRQNVGAMATCHAAEVIVDDYIKVLAY
jgi:UDP-N-acetylglucosamine--N-acetylmuramyl-(pentapeptide) pyrophosphoryl-undecaprenol N-acetylglucosamine transferase